MKNSYLPLMKATFCCFFMFFLVLFAASTSRAQTHTFTANPGLDLTPIDGLYNGSLGAMTSSTIQVSGIPSCAIGSISVDIVANHTSVGDLVIKLVSPDGTVFGLMSRPGMAEPADGGSGCCGFVSAWTGQSLKFSDLGVSDAELFGSNGNITCPLDCDVFPNPGAIATPPSTFSELYSETMNGGWTLYIGDDYSGNSGTFDSWSITFTDLCPIFTLCPVNMTVGNDPGLCTAVVSYTATADGPPPPVLTYSFSGATTGSGSGDGSGSTFNIGVTNVTITATNSNGTATCDFTVTVSESINPTIICPPDTTVNTDPGECFATMVSFGTPITADNCGIASVTNDAPSTPPPACSYIIDMYDSYGDGWNGASLTVNIDGVYFGTYSGTGTYSAATVDVPAGSTIDFYYSSGSYEAEVTYTITTGGSIVFSDGPYPVTGLVFSSSCPPAPPSGYNFPLGTTTVTWTVTDSSGNTATCIQLVTVVDNEPPVIICTNDTVSNDPGLCGAVVSYPLPIVTGSGGGGSGILYEQVGNNFEDGRISNSTWNGTGGICADDFTVAAGACYNVDNVTANFWTNNQASVTALHVYFYDDAGGIPGAIISSTTLLPGAWTTTLLGNMYGYNIYSYDITLPSTVSLCGGGSGTTYWVSVLGDGPTDFYWGLISSGYGNNGQFSQTPPLGSGGWMSYGDNFLFALWGSMPSTNPCDTSVITQTAGLPSGSFFPVGTTINTFLATDASGNTASCSSNVVVIDTEDPVATCPPDQTMGVDPGLCTANVTIPLIIATDNCGIATIVNDFNSTNDASGIYPAGTTVVTWTITDVNGNAITCSQNIIILEFIDPTILCTDTIISTDLGECFATVTALNPPATSDNCGVFSVTNDAPAIPGPPCVYTLDMYDSFGDGWNGAALTVYIDGSYFGTYSCTGSSTTATIDLPAGSTIDFYYSGGSYENEVSYTISTGGSIVFSDGPYPSTGLVFSSSCPPAPPLGYTFQLGTTTVTWTVTDNSGNTATCTQLVTVVDNESPVIDCGSNIVVDIDSGACGAVVDYPFPTIVTSYGGGMMLSATYEQLGNGFENGRVSNASFPGISADDYTVPAGACYDIDSVTASFFNNNPGNVTSLSIYFYSDAGGYPGPIISSTTLFPGDWTTTLMGSNFGFSDYKYQMALPTPVTLCGGGSGTTYWFSVLGHGVGASDFYWEFSTTGPYGNNGQFSQGMPLGNGPWMSYGDNFVFSLSYDNYVPFTLCDSAVIVQTAGLPSGSFFPIGTTTNTFLATDLAGNTSTCSFNVTVVDTIMPIITCPPAVVANTNTGCTATGVALGTPVVIENCGVPTLTNNAPLAFPLGNTTVTWTVTDGSGNTATCTQLVTVNDTVIPTITCPPTIITFTNTGCTATGVLLGSAITNDNCSVASVTNNALGVYPLGNTTVTWIVTDGSGNTATCGQLVTVIDNVVPIIICPPPVTAFTNTGCTATGVVLGTPTVIENCSVASLTNNAPPAFPLGNTTVTWTAIDGSGNSAICTQLVTVTDNVNPTITCPPTVVTTTNSGCTATGVVLGAPVTSDNCSVATVVNNAPPAFPVGNTTVIWTVTDGSGNSVTCNQLVTVTDNVNPTITCPPTVMAFTNTGCTAAGVNLGTPITNDNCGVASVTNNAPGAYPLGNTTVTWTVTDNAGNTATCTQIVTVTDNVDPMIICSAAMVVNANTGCTATGVVLITPFTNDNCSVASVANDAPLIYPLGNTTVTWTVTDGSGNTATCTQLVTVIDNVNPIITCPSDTIVPANIGCTAAGVVLNMPITSDNCGIDTVYNNAPGVFPVGVTTVIWTAVDVSGNAAICYQLVTVTDGFPPTVSCPVGISVNTAPGACTVTGVSIGFPTYTDDCSGIFSVINNAPLNYPIGTTNVLWTVTDGSGNTATCTQTVTVGSAPLAKNDTVTTPESTPIAIDVLANDVDCGNDLDPTSVLIVIPPLNGTVVVNPVTGIITYTPNYLFVGQDQFDYQVCDLGNLCSVATVYINVYPVNHPSLGIAKAVSNIEQQEDGSFNVTFVVTAQNLGNDTLNNIQIVDNLSETFPSPVTFTVPATPFTNSTITANAGFNGSTDMELLDSQASYLLIGQSATVEFTVNVIIYGLDPQDFCNTAIGVGIGAALGTVVSDTSDDGYVTDSNGNGNAGDLGENDCTPVTLVPLDVFIPHGFSPDGDGINDLFVIQGIKDYPDCILTIFNRWGSIVYTKTGYQSDWDGSLNGDSGTDKIVPRGTYYYILEFNKNDKKPANGYLVIQY